MPSDEDACNICEGDRSTSKNPIIFCDGEGCNMPVHKRCYNVQSIPEGEWYCQRCDCIKKKKKMNIVCCSTQTGAIKKTNLTNEYMHVICAIWNKTIKIEKEPYSIPESQIGIHECYFCSEKQGLCIKCEHINCSIYFHVTCAINNNLITPTPTRPHHFSIQCNQHESKNNQKKVKRRLRPSKVLSETESSEPSESESDDLSSEEVKDIKDDIKLTSDESDDDMGTRKKQLPKKLINTPTLKKRSSPDLESDMISKPEDAISYRERLEAKRKKSSLEVKLEEYKKPLVITPPPKQKLPNKSHFNTIIRSPTPIKKSIHIKDIDEIQNDIRNSHQRWNNMSSTPLYHPQPTTPHTVTTSYFETEAMKGRKSVEGWKPVNGEKEEINRLKEALKEESRKFDSFKKLVAEVFQGLNAPIQGIDPIIDIEAYVNHLQLLLKRVGPIREDEQFQINEMLKTWMKK